MDSDKFDYHFNMSTNTDFILTEIPVPHELPDFVSEIEAMEVSTETDQSHKISRPTDESPWLPEQAVTTQPSRTKPVAHLPTLEKILKGFRRGGYAFRPKAQELIGTLSRNFKRMLKDMGYLMRQNTLPPDSKTLTCFILNNQHRVGRWQQFCSAFSAHAVLLSIAWLNENEVAIRGGNFAQYGSDYLAWLLDDVSAQVLWGKYITLIFEADEVCGLCTKFGMSCCGGLTHAWNCRETWTALQNYLTNDLFVELGLSKVFAPIPMRPQ